MWVVTYGNLKDGFLVVGPFKDHEDALDWCEERETSTSNVFELTDPSDA